MKCGNHSIFPLSYARGKKFQRKFTVTDSWWGKGAHGVAVIPFRTVAVDQKEIILVLNCPTIITIWQLTELRNYLKNYLFLSSE